AASAFEIIGRGFVSIGRGCLSRPVPRARVRGENDPVASMMKRASHQTQDGRMTLRVQLILLQALIVATVTLIAGVTAGVIQAHTVRDAYEDRMLAVAQSIASMPVIRSAFADADPAATIQPLAETIRKASDLTYVVIANADGIRYSHPNPARTGERVSTDPSVPLSGQRSEERRAGKECGSRRCPA